MSLQSDKQIKSCGDTDLDRCRKLSGFPPPPKEKDETLCGVNTGRDGNSYQKEQTSCCSEVTHACRYNPLRGLRWILAPKCVGELWASSSLNGRCPSSFLESTISQMSTEHIEEQRLQLCVIVFSNKAHLLYKNFQLDVQKLCKNTCRQ